MPLSEEHQRRFRQFFRTHELHCTMCNSRDILRKPEAKALVVVDLDTGKIDPEHGIPAIQITCQQCGHIDLYSAEVVLA